MRNQILQEIQELKTALVQLLGMSHLAPEQQFSKDAIDNAAKEFQKLSIERGEWIEEASIDKVIKSAPYNAGAFIREEFGFTNYFKRGRSYYYCRKDLVDLGKELKERNINLARYKQYKEDEAKFRDSIAKAKENNKGKRGKAFSFPNDLYDITTSPPKMPPANIINADIQRLKDEFFEYNLADYIDIYKSNYAMMKDMYFFGKYLDPSIKKRCRKWCDDFNYANRALELVTKKKDIFVPVKEDDMIQL